jgi:hypothetical protein
MESQSRPARWLVLAAAAVLIGAVMTLGWFAFVTRSLAEVQREIVAARSEVQRLEHALIRNEQLRRQAAELTSQLEALGGTAPALPKLAPLLHGEELAPEPSRRLGPGRREVAEAEDELAWLERHVVLSRRIEQGLPALEGHVATLRKLATEERRPAP